VIWLYTSTFSLNNENIILVWTVVHFLSGDSGICDGLKVVTYGGKPDRDSESWSSNVSSDHHCTVMGAKTQPGFWGLSVERLLHPPLCDDGYPLNPIRVLGFDHPTSPSPTIVR